MNSLHSPTTSVEIQGAAKTGRMGKGGNVPSWSSGKEPLSGGATLNVSNAPPGLPNDILSCLYTLMRYWWWIDGRSVDPLVLIGEILIPLSL